MWKAPNGDSYNYHNADKFEGIEAHPNGVLKVSNFRKVDEGDYLCVASNKKGKQEAKTTVTFLDEETDDASSTRDLEQTDNVVSSSCLSWSERKYCCWIYLFLFKLCLS